MHSKTKVIMSALAVFVMLSVAFAIVGTSSEDADADTGDWWGTDYTLGITTSSATYGKTVGYGLYMSDDVQQLYEGHTINSIRCVGNTAGTYTFTVFCQKTGCQTAEQSITLTVVSSLVISNPTVYVIAYEG